MFSDQVLNTYKCGQKGWAKKGDFAGKFENEHRGSLREDVR